MKRLLTLILSAACLMGPTLARAFVPETVSFTGQLTDFSASNLVRDDRGDTQTNCGSALPLDIGRVYMTNDANYLYVGMEFAQTCFCSINLGFAFDVANTAAGGSTDPFGRKVGWANMAYKPDFIVYDVPPNLVNTSCNQFNYEVLYKWNTGTLAWDNASTQVNPSWGAGSNGLGIVDSVNFVEMRLPLSVLGASTAGTAINFESWLTQETGTKGPLDALMSSDVQTSHVGTTTWDTTAVVQMTHMFPYTVLNAVDTIPPTVALVQTSPTGFAVQANGQFSLLTTKVDVQFSEPVDQTTAETKTNYAFSGPLTRTVSGAAQDASAKNTVHLTLNSPITANAAAFGITVSGVKDVAGNTIVSNGTTNLGSFHLQNVAFNADMHLPLCAAQFAPTDTFSVQGGVLPLTWQLETSALLLDANTDSVYTLTVPFCIPHVPGDSLQLLWKLAHKLDFEPLSSNRVYTLLASNGATASISAAWDNVNPTDYTTHPVDVIFRVNASHNNPTGSNVITLLGSGGALHWSQPGIAMLDNGVGADSIAGDHIYSARVTFPACSPKSIDWKVDYDGIIECLGQNNRNVYLNDAIYSSANPITLPARGIDRCSVTDKPITVVFKVNMSTLAQVPGTADTVIVKGGLSPLGWGWPAAAAGIMADDGTGYDSRAHDGWFTKAVTFPDSSGFSLDFKYDYKLAGWSADSVECFGYPNRNLVLDDLTYSVANPMIRLLNPWNYCTDPGAVGPDTPHAVGTGFGVMLPVMPNPVAHTASFSFALYRAGHVTLSVYDVTGRRVARLVDAVLPAGNHLARWDGTSDGGLHLASGVYMYELAMGGERLARRMILVH